MRPTAVTLLKHAFFSQACSAHAFAQDVVAKVRSLDGTK
jgi:hypothetical protein